MAMGVPVVSSNLAARGVDAVADEHLLVVSGADDYVDAIIRVLDNKNIRSRLGNSARERVLTHHAWRSSMQRLDEVMGRMPRSGQRSVSTQSAVCR